MKPPRRLFRGRERGPIVPGQTPAPDLSHFVVLVPFMDTILHHVEAPLQALERMGIGVCRRPGCSAIDIVRSMMASAAIMEGKEAILFIDSDILFNPNDAVRLLLRPEPIVCGVYSQKQNGKLNLDPKPGTVEIGLGDQGGDYEVKGVGAGFLRIRTEALMQIADHHDLPCCTATGTGFWPFFLPFVAPDEDTGEIRYYPEDMAFCRRAREAGLKVIADTRPRLLHLGIFPYGWEQSAQLKDERVKGITIPVFRPDPEPEGNRP